MCSVPTYTYMCYVILWGTTVAPAHFTDDKRNKKDEQNNVSVSSHSHAEKLRVRVLCMRRPAILFTLSFSAVTFGYFGTQTRVSTGMRGGVPVCRRI